jgi:hypothetical protein
VDRYFASLAHILQAGRVPIDLEMLIADDVGNLARHAAGVLNQHHPDWLALVRNRIKVFPLQVPEIWIALDTLSELQSLVTGGLPPALCHA